jgi:putative oxidoreductase
MNIVISVLQVLLELFFLAAGGSKIAGVETQVKNFEHWQFPQAFRPVVGGVEVLGSLGLLVGVALPWFTVMAGLWLAAVMIGALFTHARIRDAANHFIMPIVLLGLAVLVTVFRWAAFTAHFA